MLKTWRFDTQPVGTYWFVVLDDQPWGAGVYRKVDDNRWILIQNPRAQLADWEMELMAMGIGAFS